MKPHLLLALACTGTCCKKAPPTPALEAAPAPATAVVRPPADWPEGSIDLMGINEAISVPRAVLQREQPSLDDIASRLRADAAAAAEVGAGWVRAHTAVYPNHHFARYRADPAATLQRLDTWVQATQTQPLDVLMMLSPWSGNHTREHTRSYVLRDEAAYSAYVAAVVERYDGDGIDDMPGLLRPVKHWEVDNEPDLKNSGSPREDRFDPDGFCTPEEYAHVLRLTAAAIRAADPEAKVLNGGLYRPMTDTGKAYLDALFALPDVSAVIDIQSEHAYHSDRTPRRVIQAIDHSRAASSTWPLWITETNVPSRGDEAWLDTDYQAEQVVLTYAEALARGVERVFWHTLADPPQRDGPKRRGIMDSHSLYRATPAGFERKPAADAYQRFGAWVAGASWSDVVVSELDGATAISLGDKWLVWGTGAVALAADASRAERARNGEAIPLVAEDGVVTVDLTAGAVFLQR